MQRIGDNNQADRGAEEFDNDSRNGSGRMQRFKRPRTFQSDNSLLIVKQLLVAVTSDKVFQLIDILENEAKKPDGESTIVSTLISCAEVFPTKTSTYALLVGALAGKEATRPIALKLLVQAAGSIKTGRGRRERLLVRFLGAALKACGAEVKGFFDLLDVLLEVEDEEAKINKTKESQIFTVLSAIPWIACSSSASRCDEQDDSIIAQRIQSICDKLSRVQREAALPARLASLPRAQQDRTDPACDRVAMGLAMAAEGASDRLLLQDEEFDTLLIGSSPQLPRFGESEFPGLNEAMNDMCSRVQASAGSSLGDESDDFSSTLLPLFPNGQPNEVLQVQRRQRWIERFLTRERVLDLLGSYCPKSTEAADALLALNSPYVTVECVFSAMLMMPFPEHSILYYGDVLVKLCMKAPTVIPAAIEDALDQIVVLEPENMDPDAVDRLSQWLVNHLLAFDLDWPWVKWRMIPTMDPKRSVRSLVEQVLHRLDAMLSNRNQLEDPEKAIPLELLAMLPIRNANGDSPYFGNAGQNLPMADELVTLIKSKPTAAQMSAFLAEKAPEPEWNTATRAALLVHAALYAGRASYTHTRAALERVAPALSGMGSDVDDDEEKIVADAALESAIGFWQSTPAWAVMALGVLVDVKVASLNYAMQYLAEKESRLLPYWRRRAMEDLLARAASEEERIAAIHAASSTDTDEATDLWLSRRKSQ